MINWILGNLPLFVLIDCSKSTAIENLFLCPLFGTAIVQYRSGHVYTKRCSRRAMLPLMFGKAQSVGQWANWHLTA